MTIVTVSSSFPDDLSIVPLARYAQIIQYAECEFFGVRNNGATRGCRTVWSLAERQDVARYLLRAQQMLEDELNYAIGTRRWFTDPKKKYTLPVITDWKYYIEAGVKATANISLGAAVNHATDPATIGPIITTVTDPDEVVIYHPGTEVEIMPSSVTIAAGFLSIEIPRCRMVVETEIDNPTAGIDYTVLANFEATVDIVRVYNDPSTNATLITNHNCTALCGSSGCSEYTLAACMYPKNTTLGILEVFPGTYASSVWTRSSPNCCRSYRWVELNYRAGRALTGQLEDAIVRLAHSLMPDEPCGCEVSQRLWQRDRNVPEILDRERMNCPFGMSDGAWFAWQVAIRNKIVEGSIL